MILLIDNYDSFVYNLARYVSELGGEPVVRRNDAEFLTAFPYGQDAINSGFSVYLHGL